LRWLFPISPALSLFISGFHKAQGEHCGSKGEERDEGGKGRSGSFLGSPSGRFSGRGRGVGSLSGASGASWVACAGALKKIVSDPSISLNPSAALSPANSTEALPLLWKAFEDQGLKDLFSPLTTRPPDITVVLQLGGVSESETWATAPKISGRAGLPGATFEENENQICQVL